MMKSCIVREICICIIFIFLFDYSTSLSQQQSPDLIIPITTTFDNPPYPPPYTGDYFEIGLDSTATDSIDNHLGENALPPIPPPGYPSVLFLPYNNFSGAILSYKDFRFGELPYSGVKQYRIKFCGECGTTIGWKLPPGATGLLQDLFGGVIINEPMIDSGSYHVPNNGIWDLYIIIYYENVVPVEQLSFTYYVLQNKNAVLLKWETSTETNNSGFEILRFTQNDKEWKEIGFIEGNGTTTEPKSYSFTDKEIIAGTYKYRLKQIDYDGTFKYSNELDVTVDFAPKEFVLYQNYPNPFNPTTVINFSIPENTNITLSIYNILGQTVAELLKSKLIAGNYSYQWNAGKEAAGIYICELKTDRFRSMKKMVLLR
jgi:Secretion system C-terminal sorting domain